MSNIYSSVEEVQDYILTYAEDEANRALTKEVGESASALHGIRGGGRIFRADPVQSKKGGLCLTLEPAFTRTLTKEQIARLHEIGVEAMHKALVENYDRFVGLIIGEARNERNYFDRFGSPAQTRLF